MAMCIYRNCTSVQKPFCSLAFFSLPKDYRRRLWIENSGNPELSTLSESARRVVCQKHFSPHSLRIQFHRTTLSRDAVPERWDADILNSSSESFVVEPIEITDNDDIKDDPHDKLISNEDEYADVNDYENHHIDEAEGIELVEIESEEHSQSDEYMMDNMLNSEIDQQTNGEEIILLEALPHQSPTYFHEIRIEKPDMKIETTSDIPLDTSSVAKQNLNKPPDELMELSDNQSVRHYGAAAAVVSSSTSSKSNENPSASVHISNEEDKYFALALAGILQRISPQKKAFAKVNILRYLTELEYGREATIN
ncbi:uncharacterized protein LOC119083280 [Bradysia coprophila]|uniref:uncharacterized protein LOC119083280 n=1 Tax=Bradysia coprophila TaxID=38358 RepID=UPI00187D8F5B|nr:uncharacterized protein LOC119083280 [Bradysia coprophila]